MGRGEVSGEGGWRLDPERAAAHARTHGRRLAPGCQHRLGCRCEPPHHVRCDFVREGEDGEERCALGDGHPGGHSAKATSR